MKTIIRFCLYISILSLTTAVFSFGFLLGTDYIRLRQRVSNIEKVLSEPIEIIIPFDDTIVIPANDNLEASYE